MYLIGKSLMHKNISSLEDKYKNCKKNLFVEANVIIVNYSRRALLNFRAKLFISHKVLCPLLS